MSNVNWDRVVSCVAGVDGLEVVERDESGTLGAARNVPYSRQSPQRQKPSLPSLKTYRVVSCWRWVPNPDYKHKPGNPPPVLEANMAMLHCETAYTFQSAQADPLTVTVGPPAHLTGTDVPFVPAGCTRLERLDAKPGYASTWTVVKNNCLDYMGGGDQQMS